MMRRIKNRLPLKKTHKTHKNIPIEETMTNLRYSPPSTQSNSGLPISVENQRISPNMSDTLEMGIQNEETLRFSETSKSSRLNYTSPVQQTPDEGTDILNDSGTPGKIRQTGRQSGRFRKSSTLSNIGGIQTSSSNLQRQTSFSSQATTNDAQSMFMDSIIADPQSRPITPHNPETKKKVSSVSRTESYRRARGHDDDRPRIVKRNDTYNSLPRSKKQVRQLRAANSEDSLRNAIDREENTVTPHREKPRQGRKGKDGECSVM